MLRILLILSILLVGCEKVEYETWQGSDLDAFAKRLCDFKGIDYGGFWAIRCPNCATGAFLYKGVDGERCSGFHFICLHYNEIKPQFFTEYTTYYNNLWSRNSKDISMMIDYDIEPYKFEGPRRVLCMNCKYPLGTDWRIEKIDTNECIDANSLDITAEEWGSPIAIAIDDIDDVVAVTDYITADASDGYIKALAESGRICEVLVHQWRGGRPGEGEGIYADYHPNTCFRTCKICGKCESQHLGKWK